MKSTNFAGCCTAKIIYDFGGTELSAGLTGKRTLKSIRAYLRKKINDAHGSTCLVAITNNEQKGANRVLKEMGFSCSPWMKKWQHAESKIRLWWKPPLEDK